MKYLALIFLLAFIGCEKDPLAPSTAVVSTTSSSSIARTSASCTGNVSSSATGSISYYGICYASTNTSPTIANTKSEMSGSVSGTFTRNLVSLTANTTYYYRAYAVNQAGSIAYGSVLSFKTLP